MVERPLSTEAGRGETEAMGEPGAIDPALLPRTDAERAVPVAPDAVEKTLAGLPSPRSGVARLLFALMPSADPVKFRAGPGVPSLVPPVCCRPPLRACDPSAAPTFRPVSARSFFSICEDGAARGARSHGV